LARYDSAVTRRPGQTVSEEADASSRHPREPIAGLVLVSSEVAPMLRAVPIFTTGLELGRGSFAGDPLDDERISSRHARVTHAGGKWTLSDLGSRNGTFVDGRRVEAETSFDDPRVLRVGRTLFLFSADVRRFLGTTVDRVGDALVGPTLRSAWAEIDRAARFGDVLLLKGESGVGKELAARAFHAAGPKAKGPFVAVNCAAIPEGVAERLLFGARRGAYSGATVDAEGYLQAADGGTLFLDEVAELDEEVQAKLLRALEAKEVLPLGASRSRSVDVRVCSATRDLRAAVARGRFREDLYFRIGRPEVTIPPLRERLEEMSWLIAAELNRAREGLTFAPTFVEACLLRPWPGNVRELVSEVRRVAGIAQATGRNTVTHDDLAPDAGESLKADVRDEASDARPPDDAAIERALHDEGGNVTRAARVLGWHRNQLRRWLAKRGKVPSNQEGEG
jgi:transcriptional regulator of acetoin/glycerol metabolism